MKILGLNLVTNPSRNLRDVMSERIKKALKGVQVMPEVVNDYTYTFVRLGMSLSQANQVSKRIVVELMNHRNLVETENKMREWLTNLSINQLDFYDVIKAKLVNRAELLFDQIQPFIDSAYKGVIDYGAGDGRLSEIVSRKKNLKVDLADVANHVDPQINLPYFEIVDDRVSVEDKHYNLGIITNVLHHAVSIDNVMKEIDRIVKDRLIIIETVPTKDLGLDLEMDMERTFMNDYLSNRIFRDVDRQVPGNYNTVAGWELYFEQFGWRVVRSLDLGFDQPIIRDKHHLFVLDKKNLS